MSCGNPHETNCGEVLDKVYQYLDHELGQPDYAKIKQHLAECGPCLRQYDLDEAVKALVRRSCRGEAAPEALRRRILVRITEITHVTQVTESVEVHETTQVTESTEVRTTRGA